MISTLLSPLSAYVRSWWEESHDVLFSEPNEALKILLERRRNNELKKSVHDSMHASAQQLLLECAQSPTAILFRQVGTPNRETHLFLDTAASLGLKPLILEYHEDKFVSAHNPYKRSLGKLPICYRAGKKGVMAIKYKNVCNFAAMEGKPFSKVKCLNGTPLITFHHDLSKAVLKKDRLFFDGSSWFAHMKNTARAHYEGVLPLFICDAVLFENYLNVDYEKTFVQSTVIPAFHAVEKKFGVKPLIVRLLPQHTENASHWDAYPEETEAHIPTMPLQK